ncbi:cupin domain-containing protein [Brevundimonas variabilis]|uniref:Quercetin dioxygenase-like cupin family protein n=1 Tax=Brevundimonas variabilis TaxID=74312 RepID=A0A7W9CJV3_9CAUL|nr:cupin domain-containing protein [Brevundimonas variabilis]MBB5747030.1 quercetin dioxygenase-like cupin family protein [Brevundimonas variabilis]
MTHESFRRIVTAHDVRGRSIVRSDEALLPVPIDSGDAAFRLVWATPAVPADLNAETDGELAAGKTLKGGSVIRIVDMLPGRASPMHRSWSIDYGIVMSGQLELELDGGEVVGLNPGDIVVQRATNHLWRNPSADTVCRIVFVLIEALPIEVEGRVLPEIHP